MTTGLLNEVQYFFEPISQSVLIKLFYVNTKTGYSEYTLVDSHGYQIDLGPATFNQAYDKAVKISDDKMGTAVVVMTMGSRKVKVKQSDNYFQANSARVMSFVKAQQVAMWQEYKANVMKVSSKVEINQAS